jgi:predicted nuclease of predicted toxin-antitoxin system
VRLYLDEDIASRELTSRLTAAGHDVLSPLRGEPDSRCWHYAQEHGATVVTMNVVDFVRLAEAAEDHAGLLLVYRENDPTRDMNAALVVAAVARIAAMYRDGLHGAIAVLNQFRG